MTSAGQTPEGARLSEVLRELRARTGLSLAGLAANTVYSKSSWERYLNGKKMPPKDAVEQLCRLAGEPPARCVALWELAEPTWSGRAGLPAAAQAPPYTPSPGQALREAKSRDSRRTSTERTEVLPEAPPDRSLNEGPVSGGQRPPRWKNRRVLAWGIGALVLAGAALPAVGLWPAEGETQRETSCAGRSCTGKSAKATRCGMHPETAGTYRPREGMQLDLRYEADCRAGWARVFGQRTGDVFEVTVPGEPVQRLTVADKYEAEDRISSPMVATTDAEKLRVCVIPEDGGDKECFGRGAE